MSGGGREGRAGGAGGEGEEGVEGDGVGGAEDNGGGLADGGATETRRGTVRAEAGSCFVSMRFSSS